MEIIEMNFRKSYKNKDFPQEIDQAKLESEHIKAVTSFKIARKLKATETGHMGIPTTFEKGI